MFQIPISDEDLLIPKDNEFYVEAEIDIDTVADRLKDFGTVLLEAKPVELTTHFDTFFTCVRNYQILDNPVKHIAWGLVIKCMNRHILTLPAYIANVLETSTHESEEERRLQLNTTQMGVYLLSRMAAMLETLSTTNTSLAPAIKKSKKGNKGEWGEDDGWNWLSEKVRLLVSVSSLLAISTPLNNGTRAAGSLRTLWDPPYIDPAFIRCICEMCSRLLENSQLALRVYDDVKLYVFKIFKTIVCDHDAKFRNIICDCLKELMRRCFNDQLGDVLAEGFATIAKENTDFVKVFVQDMCEIDADELRNETCNLPKTVGHLLSKLAKLCPNQMIPSIAPLAFYLDQESYQLRNAVLTVMTELLVAKLHGDDLTPNERTTRNEMLEKLEGHCHDVNAHVRTKCVQLWKYLVETRCIPLFKLASIVPLITLRLEDRSVMVRKAALSFLTACLTNNPYGHKMQPTEISGELSSAREELQSFNEKHPLNCNDTEASDFAMDSWRRIEEKVNEAIEKGLGVGEPSSDEHDQADIELVIEESDNPANRVIQLVFAALSGGIYARAVRIITKVVAKNVLLPYKTEWMRDFDKFSTEDQCIKVGSLLKDLYVEQTKKERIDSETSPDEDKVEEADDHVLTRKLLMSKVERLKDMYGFARCLEESLPGVLNMLPSVTKTDAEELATFVITCAQFQVNGHEKAVRRLFDLTWRQEVDVQNVAVTSFRHLFFDSQDAHSTTATNLISLATGASASELASLEKVLTSVMKENTLNSKALDCLWQYFCKKVACSDEESSSAILLIAMVANAEKSVVQTNLNLILEHGLGQRALSHFSFAKNVFYALEKLGQSVDLKDEESTRKEPYRLPADHPIFQKLTNILVEGVETEDTQWTPMMEHAIGLLFSLAEEADSIAANILKQILAKFVENCQSFAPDKDICNRLLVRLLGLAGQIALKLALLVDVSYYGELKRRNAVRQLAKPLVKNRSSLNNSSMMNISVQEDEGVTAASAEDVEMEKVGVMTDEAMEGGNILATLVPLVEHVCYPDTQSKYTPQVQTAAALCLAKMMLLSQKFCNEDRLQLLFTLLSKSLNEVVRANMMIAAGDLCFRFPNAVQPYCSHLYDRLKDPDDRVKQNCLLVLTHLILNDMIKVKGHVADVALVMEDEHKQMAAIAKRFFTDLARKDMKLYNLLPDIISRLSDPETRTDYVQFQSIMKFLLQKIDKDKQIENLVDKLCQRFQASDTVEQWRYLSFCIAQLSIQEKTLRRLQENVPKFADKLADKEVYNNFEQVLANAGKHVKSAEAKSDLEELEEVLAKLHENRANNEEVAERAVSAFRKKIKQSLSPRRTPKNTPRKNKFVTPRHRVKIEHASP